MLVYAACLALVGITAVAQAAVITTNFQTTTVDAIVANNTALVRVVVNTFLGVHDLGPGALSPARLQTLDAALDAMASRAGIVRIELGTTDGRVVAGSAGVATGAASTADAGLAVAGHGSAAARLVDAASAGPAGAALGAGQLLREDLPITSQEGGVDGVLTLWRDAQPILDDVQRARQEVVVLTLTAAVVLCGVLYFVFRAAQDRIRRQTDALVEATRRDTVTGMPNHGNLVELLATALEHARLESRAVAIALIDIDGFRLLNETRSHATGDEALVMVADELRTHVGPGAVVGRYGPDEFLVIGDGPAAGTLESVIQQVRADLAALAIEARTDDAGGERLPITISAGICTYPADSDNVTDLLAVAARTLSEAKAGGGDAIRFARTGETVADQRGFDVLKGLVIAIDTKDRYTKRHSEDVARYSLFIADRLGLDEAMHRTIRLAGLLHDVGKIGIPDQILRKPGKLTDAEREIFQQHVALGDLIVRDLPDIETVRVGIRHHHERWDGRGYLDALAGGDIPLVARILAVGDAFSAMTTTRPYRKAMPVQEAIRRLEDAAGTQLDEHVVRTFVEGLDVDPDAPLPGSPAQILWTPGSILSPRAQVAAA